MVITGVFHHEDRAKPLLHTWGQWLHPKQLILISDTEDEELGTVEAPDTLGGYAASQKKWHFAILEAQDKIKDDPHIDWVVVVDDDTFLVVPNLLKLLSTFDHQERAWYGRQCSMECNGPCVCGGGGWAAPTHVIHEIGDSFRTGASWPPPCCADMFYSDQIISKWMNDVANLPLTPREEFQIFPPDYTRYSAARTARWMQGYVSFHYVGTIGAEKFGTSEAVDYYLIYDLITLIEDPVLE